MPLPTFAFDATITAADQRWRAIERTVPGRKRPDLTQSPAVVTLEFFLADPAQEIDVDAYQAIRGKRVRVTVEQLLP